MTCPNCEAFLGHHLIVVSYHAGENPRISNCRPTGAEQSYPVEPSKYASACFTLPRESAPGWPAVPSRDRTSSRSQAPNLTALDPQYAHVSGEKMPRIRVDYFFR